MIGEFNGLKSTPTTHITRFSSFFIKLTRPKGSATRGQAAAIPGQRVASAFLARLPQGLGRPPRAAPSILRLQTSAFDSNFCGSRNFQALRPSEEGKMSGLIKIGGNRVTFCIEFGEKDNFLKKSRSQKSAATFFPGLVGS